jgi:hypothetical protein
LISRFKGTRLVLALCCAPFFLSASTNYVTNGSFETTTNGSGQFNNNTVATGWTSTGYNFIFASGTADTTGAMGQDGLVYLWGPGNGANNGLPASSPDGGNYVAADGAYLVEPIQQTINGLTVGASYTLGFWWGGAQQESFTGPTSDQWDVSLGSQTQDTVVLQDVNHGFTGWQYQTFTFVASSTSELLSFLAVGTPSGEPPFALLDGVSLTQVAQTGSTPEPATFGLIGLGLIAIPVASRLFKSARKSWLKKGRNACSLWSRPGFRDPGHFSSREM